MAPASCADGGYDPFTSDSRLWDRADRYHVSVPDSNTDATKPYLQSRQNSSKVVLILLFSLWSLWGINLDTSVAEGFDMRDKTL